MSNQKTLSGALYTSIPALFLNLISVLVTPVIIRQLGKEQYGQWAASVSLTTLVFLLASFGLRPLFIRRIADASVDTAKETAYQLGIRGGLGVLSLVLTLLACLALGYPKTVFFCTLVATVSSLLVSFNSALGDVLQGNQNLKLLAIINFIAGLSLTVLSLAVVLLGGGPVEVAISYTVGPILSLFLLFWAVNKNYFPVRISWDSVVFKERFNEARLVGISQIFAASRDRIEHVLVPKFVGIAPYGLFNASTVLTERLTVVSSSLGDAFFAPIAKSVKEGPDKVTQQVGNLLLAGLAFCMPISLILAFLSQLLASILLPLNIPDCASLILITVWSLPIYAFWQGMVVALQATQAHDEAARANLETTAISVVVSVVLIYQYSLLGAAISQITRPALGCAIYWRVFNPRFPGVLKLTIRPALIFCFVIMGSFLWVGDQYFAPKMEQILHYSPWVTRKTGRIIDGNQVAEVVLNVLLILAWAVLSLVVLAVSAVLFKIAPFDNFVKRLKRNQK